MVAITAKAAMPDEAMLQAFNTNILDKPEVFLTKSDKYTEQAKAMTKHLYDLGKASETQEMKSQGSMLEELFIDGFDNDQIWEEIQMQNVPFLDYLKSQLKALKAGKAATSKEDGEEEVEEADENAEQQEQDEDDDEDMEVDEDELSMMNSDMEHDSDMLDSAAGEESDDPHLDAEEDVEEDEEAKEAEEESSEDDLEDLDLPATKKAKMSEVDDDFFKIDEFNALTEKQEQDELDGKEPEDDDEIDYFADPDEIESGDDFGGDEDDEDEALVDAHDVKYTDFFAPVKTSRSKAKPAPKRPKAQHTEDEENEDDFGFGDEDEGDMEDEKEADEDGDAKVNALGDRISDLFSQDVDEDDDDESKLSKYERMQRKMRAQIEQLEQENVAPKEWTKKGETSATDRPVNSLLEEDLEFETVAKPVPVITAETTKTLEDIIKDRILNNNYDDVVRRQAPNPKAFNPSSRVEISDEKSKKSLAELYEDDFKRQTSSTGPVMTEREAALEKQHQEITEAWKELCSKLDALSNWHYTPKPVKAELTVVTNAPAISMEEAIPVSVADAALLAPEEIYSAGKTPIKGETEMDQTDRKRKRSQAKRAKKAEIKEKAKQAAERQKEREERDRRMGRQPGDKGNSKTVVRDKLDAVKQLSGQQNISFIDRDGNKRSSIKPGSQVDVSKSAKLKL